MGNANCCAHKTQGNEAISTNEANINGNERIHIYDPAYQMGDAIIITSADHANSYVQSNRIMPPTSTHLSDPNLTDDQKLQEKKLLEPGDEILELISKYGMFDFPIHAYPGMVNPYMHINQGDFTYYGQVDIAGKKQGKGQIIGPSFLHIGYFYDDKRQGPGRTYFVNRQYLQSDWSEDKLDGLCLYVNEIEGQTSNCMYAQGKKNGDADERWRDGSYFIGTYIEGLKSGTGEMRWSDGNRYKGQLKDGQMHGEGTFTWTDGKQYRGRWLKDKMHGKGEFTWPDGRKYEGKYANDKKEGYGVFHWSANKWYEGYWKEGSPHGEGKLHDKDGIILQGIWHCGELTTK